MHHLGFFLGGFVFASMLFGEPKRTPRPFAQLDVIFEHVDGIFVVGAQYLAGAGTALVPRALYCWCVLSLVKKYSCPRRSWQRRLSPQYEPDRHRLAETRRNRQWSSTKYEELVLFRRHRDHVSAGCAAILRADYRGRRLDRRTRCPGGRTCRLDRSQVDARGRRVVVLVIAAAREKGLAEHTRALAAPRRRRGGADRSSWP